MTALTKLHDFSTITVPAIADTPTILAATSPRRSLTPAASPLCSARPPSYTTRRWKGKKAAKASKTAARASRLGRGAHEENEAHADADGDAALSSGDGDGGDGGLTLPTDLTDLEARYRRVEEYFSAEMARVRAAVTSAAAANSLGEDMLGSVAVRSSSNGKSSSSGPGGASTTTTTTTPLRELATITPLGGRRWSIVAHDEASVKAIMSAVQNSNTFNQQPQRAGPDSPCVLFMSLEPATPETLRARAHDVGTRWRERIRGETHRREDRNKKWRKEGVVSEDAFFTVAKKIAALQDKAMKTILDREKDVLAALTARGTS